MKKKGYLIRCVLYDKNLFNLLKRLERKQGMFIELALRHFLSTDEGQRLLELFVTNEDDWKMDLDEEIDKNDKNKKKKKIIVDDFL